MTEQEMEMWQRIDIMGDHIEKLEQKIDEQVRAFTIAMNLIADAMEKKNDQ